MYRLLRDILFNFDAEDVHHLSMTALHYACKIDFIKNKITKSFNTTDASLHKTVFGLPFKNPVGLGAGFDKNA